MGILKEGFCKRSLHQQLQDPFPSCCCGFRFENTGGELVNGSKDSLIDGFSNLMESVGISEKEGFI